MNKITLPLRLGADCLPLTLKKVPGGQFLMGSNEGLGFDDFTDMPMGEFPVFLTSEYWLGVYPVTQCQWQEVMGTNPSRFEGANLPVDTVSWHDAMDFCHQLNVTELPKLDAPESYEFTLPTEAQWEFACKATSTHKYQLGNTVEVLSKVAWYGDNIPTFSTQVVGQKLPNNWGFYDMLGNVTEWCLDVPVNYPDGSPHVDWMGAGGWGKEDGFRIIRGSSICHEPEMGDYLTCTRRSFLIAEDALFWCGFRLCLSKKQSE